MKRSKIWKFWYSNKPNFASNSSGAKLEEIKKRRIGFKPSAAAVDPEEKRIQAAKNRFINKIAPYTKGPKVRRDLTPFTKDPEQDYDRMQGIHAE